MTHDLVSLGALLIDMAPAELGRSLVEVSAWYPKPGGAPANVAVAAARLGAASGFVGKVGDDPFGHFLAQVLAENGVDVRAIRYDAEARTTLAFYAKPDPDTAEFVFYRNPGADTRLLAGELDEDMLRHTRCFHFDGVTLDREPARAAALRALDLAGEGGALLSFDMNYRPALWPSAEIARDSAVEALPLVNLLKINEGELELLTGSQDLETGCRYLRSLGPQLIVVTLGSEGSYFQVAEGAGQVPPFRVQTVDAVGCGDAFIAGLLTQLVAGGDWRAHLSPQYLSGALRWANAVGALTATVQGVIPALPTSAQVAAFLQRQAVA